MLRRVRRWLALPARERRMLLVLAVLQPVISIALRQFGYRRTRAWLERHSDCGSRRQATVEEMSAAQRLAELARIAGRHGLMETTCLRQGLAVHWLLRRKQLQSELKLGVGRLGNLDPDMHAWVELDGHALAQSDLRHAAFSATAASRHVETTATTSGKRE